jgi:ParB-like chromosome segregation protein Spo0J
MTGSRNEEAAGTAKRVAVWEVGTLLGRARCPQPAQVTRMRQSLSRHGQLMPVIVVERDGKLELVDGFKRHAAVRAMGWRSIWVIPRPLDERGQWTAMLTLNRTNGSLTVLEEGLIVRELCLSGLTQIEIGQLVGRHKSWVSRRLGLVERLHPELLEQVRLGLLPAGQARRLIVLPAGNQVELAAAAVGASLSTEETELLVSLWQKTKDPSVRRFLVTEPRRALEKARPEKAPALEDPRLSERGRKLYRALWILRGVSLRVIEALSTPMEAEDLRVLEPYVARTRDILPHVLTALGTAASPGPCDSGSEASATPTSVV